MQQLYFGKQPAFNRFGASRRGGHPAPTQYGDLVTDPDQVLARIAAEHQESRHPVSVQLVCVACNALSVSQQRLVKGVLVDLVIAGQLEMAKGGVVPVSLGGGE